MQQTQAGERTIAFLGAGQMGEPMASRLLSAGFHVRVWNRSSERLQSLVESGAIAAATPALAATGANVIVTMLTDGPAIEAVINAEGGVLSSLASGAVWLQMSTIGVEWTDRLQVLAASAGVLFVDAPVSGSVAPATSGDLLILASGPPAAQQIADTVFAAMARHTFWLGGAGAGSRAKLVLNNWLVDLVEMVAETLKFSETLGLNPDVIVDILQEVPLSSPFAISKARTMLSGDFTPSFALKHAVKDAMLALDAANELERNLPLTSSFITWWQQISADGAGDDDLSVIYRYAPG
jgi:3-hydroxyisobutyrate dehydrogenase